MASARDFLIQRMPVSQPGVTSTAGEGYIDDRGTTLMYLDQHGNYVVGDQSYLHYPNPTST